MMKRVLILVEGQTEETFVKSVLSTYLIGLGVTIQPRICWTRRFDSGKTFKGGVASFPKIERQVLSLMGDSGASLVTTMLDYYGFPHLTDRPNAVAGSAMERVKAIESAIEMAIDKKTSRQTTPKFTAYLSLHEFESLLFSDTDAIAKQLGGEKKVEIDRIREAFKPEEINDGRTTCPSARLRQLYPKYKKRIDGPQIASNIGLPRIRSECPHFDGWLTSIEQLAAAE